jgi:hypothetical protein
MSGAAEEACCFGCTLPLRIATACMTLGACAAITPPPNTAQIPDGAPARHYLDRRKDVDHKSQRHAALCPARAGHPRAPITHPDRQSHRAPRPALKGVLFGRRLGVPFARRLTHSSAASTGSSSSRACGEAIALDAWFAVGAGRVAIPAANVGSMDTACCRVAASHVDVRRGEGEGACVRTEERFHVPPCAGMDIDLFQ